MPVLSGVENVGEGLVKRLNPYILSQPFYVKARTVSCNPGVN